MIRHDWPEKAGFIIDRPCGREDYTFLHFMSYADISVNGKMYSVKPGACIFYSPETPQWFKAKDPLLHNWVHIDSSLNTVLKSFDIPQNEILYPQNTSFISEIFGKAEAEFFSDGIFRSRMLNTYMLEFLIKFSRAINQPRVNSIPDKNEREIVSKLRRKILSEPEKKWTVAEMASMMSISPSRFHALYKSIFGTSPMSDVIGARIYYAQSLLVSDKNSSIYEIAERLGYSDQYHFIRQFKKLTGETPAAYRKKRRQN